MRKYYISITLMTVALAFISNEVISQSPKLTYLGFHFAKEGRKKMVTDFEQHNNLIVLPIEVNGLDTLNFVLDTGVGYTLITDPEIMNRLGLKCLREVRVAGSGEGDELIGCISNVARINYRGIEAFNHNIVVLSEDVLHLSRYAGVKIHGIIGYDLFSKFVIKINYQSRRITFYNPNRFIYKGKGEHFPISIEQMKPYIEAEAELVAGSTPVKLILDTGAGHSLSLDRGTHPNIQIPPENIESQLGMTLNGRVKGAIGRIHKFKIGSYEMQRVVTSFPDSSSLRFMRNLANRQGNLGCGVLKRFHLIFNYPNKELILKPNRRFNEPFEVNTSGIDLIAEAPNYKTFKIANIRNGSPAEEAGLQEGDIIIAINNELTSNLTLNNIYRLINRKEGKTIFLMLRRNEDLFFRELLLKEPF